MITDELSYRKDALVKRRGELIQQIVDLADEIKRIDDQLEVMKYQDLEDDLLQAAEAATSW